MSLPRSVLRATWWWLPLGACRWKSGGSRPEQTAEDMDVELLAGRLGQGLRSRGGALPSSGAALGSGLGHKDSRPLLGRVPGLCSMFQPTLRSCVPLDACFPLRVKGK